MDKIQKIAKIVFIKGLITNNNKNSIKSALLDIKSTCLAYVPLPLCKFIKQKRLACFLTKNINLDLI